MDIETAIEPVNVVANGQKIGPGMTKRSNCALLKIRAELQRAIIAVEEEIDLRIERKVR